MTPTRTGTSTRTATATATVALYSLRVNAGGGDYLDWVADQQYTVGGWGFVDGFTYSTVEPIAGTPDQPLYQTERYWHGTGGYKFTVPNGTYNLVFKFAEIYPYTSTGYRVFSVKLEGATKISGLDVFAVAPGRYRAHDVPVSSVVVADGVLDIDFVPIAGNPAIKAIAINAGGGPPPATSTPTPTPTATPTIGGSTGCAPALYCVNAGGGAYVDGSATWESDQQYLSGGWGYVGGFTYTNVQPIGNTTDDGLYQTERWWNGTGTYKFSVPNGSHNVTLRFAEIYPYAYEGGRVFKVYLEGVLKPPTIDIADSVGLYNAYDLTYSDVVVTDGVLQIDLVPTTGSPKISGIRIWQ
jgi:Malectin domain